MESNGKPHSKHEFPAHWLETIIKKIEDRNPKQITLVTGKTPSGHIHMGIMRELLICDALRRLFEKKNQIVRFRLFLDDLDAAKRFPSYISHDYLKNNIGKPFANIPNPFEDDGRTYAQVFGEELINTFPEYGIKAEIVWTHNFYQMDEMKAMIRIGLKKNQDVKKIVAKFLTASMTEEQKSDYIESQKTWMGAMVICEQCSCTQKKQKDGTISPNRVTKYDEEADECEYTCPACGFKGRVKISEGAVKLNWRLDWPAKWTILNTTCEPAGKDHCTPGGSYDTGLELCKKIYDYEGPVKVSYEWLRLGDKDMGTSKGIVFTPNKFLEIASPEIIRLLIYQTNPNKHISFRVEELEQYYNEYQRIEKIFFGMEEALSEQEKREILFIYPLLQIDEVPQQCPVHIPFKLQSVLAQLLPVLKKDGIIRKVKEYLKNEGGLDQFNQDQFLKQINRASKWIIDIKILLENEKDPQKIKKIKQKIVLFSFTENVSPEIKSKLDPQQLEMLKRFLDRMNTVPTLTEENIKQMMVDLRDELEMKAMKIFQAFYLIFFGEKRGPRLGPLMVMLDKDWIVKKIQEVIEVV
ncbi:MAG: lysine--tRNA ligase [Promethearchaeota archaeon]